MSLKKWHGAEKTDEEDIQNLIVFGYQCKIFRDDEKALFIDKGNHLIPWMGDSSLMIDRYDGRGHISDLRPFDADNVDTTHYSLSDKEKVVEKAADEERYLELHTNVIQQQQYEEEEMKRLYESMGEGYAAVAFNYEQPQPVMPAQEIKPPEDPEEEEDFPYETIPDLQVPKGVNLPATIKMHAIIEKTAAFVAKQGAQMEIVVATKQANNRQFDFLHYSNELNIYYKHVVKMIKNGKYKPPPQEEYSKIRRRRSSENVGHHDYLHPSLGGGQDQGQEEMPPQSQENFLKSVTAKLPTGQIANTAYAKLLTNLSKHRAESPVPSSEVAPSTKKVSGKNVASAKNKKSQNSVRDKTKPLVSGLDPVTLPGPNQPPPPGTEPLDHLPQTNQKHDNHPQSDAHYNGEAAEPHEPVYFGPQGPPGKELQTSREMTSHEPNTASEENNQRIESTMDSVSPEIELPPSELQSIIDKMAQYVVRNGSEFERMMQSKQDERFSFLDPCHRYNKYYENKVTQFRNILTADKAAGDAQENAVTTAAQRGVSFSIKPKDSETGQMAPTKRRAALLGDSDEEEEQKEDGSESGTSSHSSGEDSSSEGEGEQQQTEDAQLKACTQEAEETEHERKIAEENLKNKLALAARGKLVQAKEDEKVKAERKKKAARFAALLKNNPNAAASEEASLPKIPSVSSLASLGLSREASPLPPSTLSRTGSTSLITTNTTEYTSRSRTRSPASVSGSVTATSKSRKRDHKSSRSKSPKNSSSHRKRRGSRRKSRSRSRSRSRHRRRRRRSVESASPPAKVQLEVDLPSAYTVVRRTSPPSLLAKRMQSTTRSPSRHKHSKHTRTRSPKRSKSHRSSRSRSKTRRHKRSRSKESRSKGKSKSHKRSRSHDKKKSKKRKKQHMIPIPELPKSSASSSQSEEEKETITIEDSPEQSAGLGESPAISIVNSWTNSPCRTSDVDSKSSEQAVKPSENLLMKVRAMLRSQREEASQNGFPGD